MKVNQQIILFPGLFLISILSAYYFFIEASQYDEFTKEECTIGVVSANSTSDGRPLLWKIRDNSDFPSNEVVYDTTCIYKFVAVVNNGDTSVWMGVNEKGLAIVNSTSKDLPAGISGYSNGTLMRVALGYCGSVQEFENLLFETNETGRKTQANFALIDSTGAAVIYETSGNAFSKFDADNSRQAPNGYIIRTNFSLTGGGSEGIQRYNRSVSLIEQLYFSYDLNYESIIKHHLRDLSDEQSNPVEIPYMNRWASNKPFGYINSTYSVCRSKSISASIFSGVLEFEPANHTTMWTTIGQPATTITLPFWPVGETPALTRGDYIAPVYQAANEIKSYLFDYSDPLYLDSYQLRDDLGNGILNHFLRVENSIIDRIKEIFEGQRISSPGNSELLLLENELSELVHSELLKAKNSLASLIKLIVKNNSPYTSANNHYNFRDGCIIQLIDAGDDGLIDPPISDPLNDDYGMPGGDDKVVGRPHFLGENTDEKNMFYFPVLLWKEETNLPFTGDKVYLRIFNTDVLVNAEYYGETQLYTVNMRTRQEYHPEILMIVTFGGKAVQDKVAWISDETKDFHVYQNYPNPFNPTTKIKFTIPIAGDANFTSRTKVMLIVYDISGNEIATLVNEEKPAGTYEIEFDASMYNLSSGIYFYRITAGSYRETKRMVLIK
ncbi:T9SS type A sorting domain-containing protein [Bacteroidota bacterium]